MSCATQQGVNIPKVVLTKTIIEDDKKVIFSKNRFKDAPILEGKLLNYQSADTFTLYGGTSLELVDSHIVASIKPAITITIVVQGKLTFGYDDLELSLDGDKQVEAVMVNVAQPASFHRSIERNNTLTKINLILSPQWVMSRLGNEDSATAFLSGHLQYIRLNVDNALMKSVNQLLSCEQPRDLIAKLNFESLALQLVEKMFVRLGSTTTYQDFTQPDSKTNEQNLSERIKDILYYIETQLKHSLNLASIAKHFSMSSSNLQRIFKEDVGITVKSYVRQRRLHLAKSNLEKGLVTITEAAYEAGYNHPANFTIAFKKEFGIPPAKVVKTE
ncbi:AraC family transcriptional regulator [Vibrio sinaloensis]|uniref:AraC family transcriptional regulator n=1 Tax=Photobacterium sp. (strain ATCC 43367) TaxID=379097 RepID=UPI0035EB4D75